MALLNKIRTVEELKPELKGRRVLMRVDFNVPIKEGMVTDNTRIRESLPTIKFLIDNGAKVILTSHLGRPGGKPDPKYSLRPAAGELENLLGKKVGFVDDCKGTKVKEFVQQMKEGDVVLLENVRFYKQEEKNDETFSKELAEVGEFFVSDAFGSAHRAHSSVCGVAKHLKSAAGFLMLKEIKFLSQLLETPQKPFVAILGGAKVSDKIPVLRNLIGKVDKVLIGGGMAFTFLKAKGVKVGTSKTEDDKLDMARQIMQDAQNKGTKVVLPDDFVSAREIKQEAETKIDTGEVSEGFMGLDIGEKTVQKFKDELKGANTIFWNGPVGVFEIDRFANGTREIAQFLGEMKATVVLGGGDTVAAAQKFGIADKVSHVSTGGGASLEFLEGKELPGVVVLLK
jgi:3-phosphoglycerate kinase